MDAFVSFLITLGLLILALSILVTIHELGHFLPAKWFGMRVDKFFLFFDWPRKLLSVKYKGTEYGIGLIPFGGYVKIAGMIDESMDTEQFDKEDGEPKTKEEAQQEVEKKADTPKELPPPEPWEFRAKSVPKKMIVICGGVIMNVLLAIAIYTGLLFAYGKTYIKNDSLKYGIYVEEASPLYELGVCTGDNVLKVNDQEVKYFREIINPTYFLAENPTMTIERDGQTKSIDIPTDYLDKITDAARDDQMLASINYPTIVTVPDSMQNADGSIGPNTLPAKVAGLQTGDRILSLDGEPVQFWHEMSPIIQKHKGEDLAVSFIRASDTLEKTLKVDTAGIIGVSTYDEFLETEQIKYGFFESLGQGTSEAFGTLWANMQGLGKVIRGEASVRKNLAGPVRIAGMFRKTTDRAGWVGFLMLTAMLSMWLAFVNILPIPALDGGHLMFLIYEAFAGKEPPLKLRMAMQQIGFLLMLLLMAFIVLNDFL